MNILKNNICFLIFKNDAMRNKKACCLCFIRQTWKKHHCCLILIYFWNLFCPQISGRNCCEHFFLIFPRNLTTSQTLVQTANKLHPIFSPASGHSSGVRPNALTFPFGQGNWVKHLTSLESFIRLDKLCAGRPFSGGPHD